MSRKRRDIPLGYRVVVKQDSVLKMSEGGIVFAKATTERDKYEKMEGTVIAIGPDSWADSNTQDLIRVGDKVTYQKYAGLFLSGSINEDEEQIRVMMDSDIMTKIVYEDDDDATESGN